MSLACEGLYVFSTLITMVILVVLMQVKGSRLAPLIPATCCMRVNIPESTSDPSIQSRVTSRTVPWTRVTGFNQLCTSIHTVEVSLLQLILLLLVIRLLQMILLLVLLWHRSLTLISCLVVVVVVVVVAVVAAAAAASNSSGYYCSCRLR